jgi:pyridinium-3,5-biscarboxylic acid mononucleotide sulfurtransferase
VIMKGSAGASSEGRKGSTKLDRLKGIIASYKSVLVAFSGGLDSTFLVRAAHDVLGDSAVAFTIVSPLTPSMEREEAARLARVLGVRRIVKKLNPLQDPVILSNPRDRCFHCKMLLYREGLKTAAEHDLAVFMDGTTAEDARSDRPGLRAIKELGVRTPLADAGFTREDVRFHSRELGLPTWDKPSQSCLATRIPYGDQLDESTLVRLDQCERSLWESGFSQVRARLHGKILRIEVPVEELGKFGDAGLRKKLVARCRELGFRYITVDLEGFVSGSMDRE